MLNVRLACDHLFGKLLFTWLSLVMSMMVSFVLSFFPRDVLDEILNLIESVSEDFPSYSWVRHVLWFLYSNRYHVTKNVFKYTYCLRHDSVFQCVIQDQPLHRCLVVSSFYLCSFMNPMFQKGDMEIHKICRWRMLQFPIFYFLLIQINSYTNHQNGILACARIYFLLYFFFVTKYFNKHVIFFIL